MASSSSLDMPIAKLEACIPDWSPATEMPLCHFANTQPACLLLFSFKITIVEKDMFPTRVSSVLEYKTKRKTNKQKSHNKAY